MDIASRENGILMEHAVLQAQLRGTIMISIQPHNQALRRDSFMLTVSFYARYFPLLPRRTALLVANLIQF
jgi:hypothetical protein